MKPCETCVNCGNMKMFDLKQTFKQFRCVKDHLLYPWSNSRLLFEKKLNSRGMIDGMTHRIEFKKAKTCPDWDDNREDKFDKALKVWMEDKVFDDDISFEYIIRIYQMSGILSMTRGEWA